MMPFHLTDANEDRVIFIIATTEHDSVLNSKSYKVIKKNDNYHGNTLKVKAKKIGSNMVHLCIDESYYVDASEIFAIIAQEISEVNLGNIIPVNMSQNGKTAIVFFAHR